MEQEVQFDETPVLASTEEAKQGQEVRLEEAQAQAEEEQAEEEQAEDDPVVDIQCRMMTYYKCHSIGFREVIDGKNGRQVGSLTNRHMPLQSLITIAQMVLDKLNGG